MNQINGEHKVLIAGGTGLIGNRLCELLSSKGMKVVLLSRSLKANSKYPTYKWDPAKDILDPASLEGVTHIVSLAGTSISDHYWTTAYKNDVVKSRLDAAATLLNALTNHPNSVQKIIAASAVGFYGNRGDEVCNEESSSGTGFLSITSTQWEKAYAKATIPVTTLRVGVVLSKDGGALPQLAGTTPYGITTILGTGKQWISWIDLDDVCGLFAEAITNEKFTGTINAVAPNPMTQEAFMQVVKKQFHSKGILLPVPAFLLRIILGEKAAIVLDSTRVSAAKALKFGYTFRYETAEQSLAHIYGN